MKKLYGVGNRDIMELDTYADHVHAMTGEGLHGKSDIAAELAFRDATIEALKSQLESVHECSDRNDRNNFDLLGESAMEIESLRHSLEESDATIEALKAQVAVYESAMQNAVEDVNGLDSGTVMLSISAWNELTNAYYNHKLLESEK